MLKNLKRILGDGSRLAILALMAFTAQAEDLYLDLDGTDYVQTNYMPKHDTCFELDFMIFENTSQQFLVCGGGPQGNANDLMTRIYVNGAGGYSWAFANDYNYTPFPENSQVLVESGRRMQAIVDGYNNKTALKSEGVTLTEKTMTTTHTVDGISNQIQLFYNYEQKRCTRGRLYGFKISEGGVLIHDYSPVCENGVTFLRDAITGQTLYRTKEEPYVESTGYQAVVLDYKPNAKSVIEVECSHVQRTSSRYVFGTGSDTATADVMFAWMNNNATDPGIELVSHCTWSWRQVTGDVNLASRLSVILDVPASYVTTRKPTGRISYTNLAKDHGGYKEEVTESALPMALFNVNRAPIPYASGVACRIYRTTIKEEGKIIHLYEPLVRNGEVGFVDRMTGKFFAGALNSGKDVQVNGLLPGGKIPYEGSIPEAYVECDQTQYILTDILPTPTTKVEIDFQLTKVHNNYNLFGTGMAPTWTLYVNWVYGYTTICHTGWDTVLTTDYFADMQRTRAVLDRVRGTLSIYRGGSSWVDWRSYKAANSQTGTDPFGIFARNDGGKYYPDATTGGVNGTTPARIYAFRVWDNETLTHELLPYKGSEGVGLKDTVTGRLYKSDIGNELVVGGKGFAGDKVFATSLKDAYSVKNGETTDPITVYAPGAIRYEWTRDGKVLADVTGDSATFEWERSSTAGGQQAIRVTPIYNVYGYEIKGDPSTATLINQPLGFSVFVR